MSGKTKAMVMGGVLTIIGLAVLGKMRQSSASS